MKLSQLFSGEVRTDNTAHTTQPAPAQTEQMNRQIRSLVPGQTISGEIVGRNGNEVQIKLSEDIVLNARVDQNMNIEIGKNMTFEVKNNGSSLTLSPLFTNVATGVNVLKALDMAGLPVNRDTVDMTEQLMAAGLPVNKGSLQQIFREISSFPQAAVSDIVNLHRLQMPVNEANVNQMVSYRNLTHQLVDGMNDILGALPEVFDSMMAKGDVLGAVRLYQEVLSLAGDAGYAAEAGNAQGDSGSLTLQGGEALASGEGAALPGTASEAVSALGESASADAILSLAEGLQGDGLADGIAAGALDRPADETGQAGLQGNEADAVQGSLRAAAAGEAMELIDSLNLTEEETAQLQSQIRRFAGGQMDAGLLFAKLGALAEGARTSQTAMHALERLFSGENFRAFFADKFKADWMLRPEELAVPGKVEELYRRLDRQLKGLAGALENAGQSGSGAYQAAASMSQNVDFLNQLNQMYSYVQLPLRLQQRTAHGDLYVYTNKKNLARKDGNVSALLHLDMAHLGPVDVYVAMQNNKVNTKFYLQDDEMIDFMAAHMDILTARLRKRGYECSYAMTIREERKGEAAKGGLEPLLRQERGAMLSRYAFDVRT